MSTDKRSWVFVGTKQHSGALKSRVPWCREHSLVLMVPRCHAHKCSMHHDAMLMSTLEWPWGLTSTQECLWVLISTYECSWHHCTTLMSAHSCFWAFIIAHKQLWPLISTSAIAPTVLISFHDHSWVWGHGVISTQTAMAPYSLVVLSTLECSWLLMGTLKCSWVLLSAQVLFSVINKKC